MTGVNPFPPKGRLLSSKKEPGRGACQGGEKKVKKMKGGRQKPGDGGGGGQKGRSISRRGEGGVSPALKERSTVKQKEKGEKGGATRTGKSRDLLQ